MEPVLVRVDDDDADVAICEALWIEYGDWAVREYTARYGRVVQPDHAGVHESLPQLRGPLGRLYLVRLDGAPVGTGALKPLGEHVAEIKRVYVRPQARGRGIARCVLERLLADAARLGYERVRLDTLEFMIEAIALYRSLGFTAIEPYAAGETASRGVEAHSVYLEREVRGD
jgi:GNAT superfamily N-acetyltransferase